MSFDEFRTEHLAKDVTFPNCDPNQCMTLMHAYLQEVLAISDPFSLAAPTAYDVWVKFPEILGADKFTQVENTPDGVPPKGALVFFEQNEVAETSPAGHVCIAIEGDVNRFTSFDANWGENTQPREVTHSYDGVVGWLVPLSLEQPAQEAPVDANIFPYGLDLNNPESVKVCVDIWKEVTDGKFVRKEVLDAETQKANELAAQVQQLTEAHAALPEQVRQDLISKLIAHLGL